MEGGGGGRRGREGQRGRERREREKKREQINGERKGDGGVEEIYITVKNVKLCTTSVCNAGVPQPSKIL